MISVSFGDGSACVALLPLGGGSAPARNQPWSHREREKRERISPGAWSPGTEPSALGVWGGDSGRPKQCVKVAARPQNTARSE